MESVLSSDDSCDRELKCLKNQLTEYGLEEDNLSREEMVDLITVLKYSKTTVQDEELLLQVDPPQAASVGLNAKVLIDPIVTQVSVNCEQGEAEGCKSPPKVTMKRRYLNVKDRRMPWSILPNTLTPSEKARTLAAYIKVMSINSYRQARQSVNLAAWPPPIQIFESTRTQPLRSTRSGRSVPVYTDLDEDSSDFDCVITKTKKRKVSNSDQHDAANTKRVLSLKRKMSKDENIRPIKEAKVTEVHKSELENHNKTDVYSVKD